MAGYQRSDRQSVLSSGESAYMYWRSGEAVVGARATEGSRLTVIGSPRNVFKRNGM